MHILKLTKPLTRTDGRRYESDSYLCEDLTAFEMAIEADRGSVSVRIFDRRFRQFPRRITPTLLVSNGGYGDLMMLGPAVRAFIRQGKGLTVCCRARSHCVFDNLSIQPRLIDYPMPARYIADFNTILTTEHLQEDSEEGRTVPAIDIKARILGVKLEAEEERRVEYIVTQEEQGWASLRYPKTKKRIGIQMAASSPSRTYHPKLLGAVLKSLYEAGHELMLFGSPGSLPDELVPKMQRDRIRNLAADRLTFRQSAAVVSTCDAMLTPDSSLLHVAGALNIPTVALFASTHWKLRAAQYKSVLAIQAHAECAPCWWHPKGAQLWPKGMPCEKAGYCGPMAQIDPDRIVRELEKKLK